MSAAPREVARGVWLVPDTCNVYLVIADEPADDGARTAIAVDFGAGAVLDHLTELGVDRITDVVMTHHHRDQGQGLPRAVEHGARIHVPPVEVDLFARVDEMWATRQLENDYNVRQDRCSSPCRCTRPCPSTAGSAWAASSCAPCRPRVTRWAR
jgi:glyoxylase-like metal-dependent hydrolase (beta-lactamase superfamily II)